MTFDLIVAGAVLVLGVVGILHVLTLRILDRRLRVLEDRMRPPRNIGVIGPTGFDKTGKTS